MDLSADVEGIIAGGLSEGGGGTRRLAFSCTPLSSCT